MTNSGSHGLILRHQKRRWSQTPMTRFWTVSDAYFSYAAGVLTGPSRRLVQISVWWLRWGTRPRWPQTKYWLPNQLFFALFFTFLMNSSVSPKSQRLHHNGFVRKLCSQTLTQGNVHVLPLKKIQQGGLKGHNDLIGKGWKRDAVLL